MSHARRSNLLTAPGGASFSALLKQQAIGKMSLTIEKFSDAWNAAVSASAPAALSCAVHKAAGMEDDSFDFSVTVTSAQQHDFRSHCAFIFLIDNRCAKAPFLHFCLSFTRHLLRTATR